MCFIGTNIAIIERAKLFEFIHKTLKEYKLKKADLPGVPPKSLIWFHYNIMQKIPSDREQRRRYDEIKFRLRHEHQEIPLFTLNQSKTSD